MGSCSLMQFRDLGVATAEAESENRRIGERVKGEVESGRKNQQLQCFSGVIVNLSPTLLKT